MYISFAQLVLLICIFFEGSGFFGVIVNFIIQKLKSKLTSLKDIQTEQN